MVISCGWSRSSLAHASACMLHPRERSCSWRRRSPLLGFDRHVRPEESADVRRQAHRFPPRRHRAARRGRRCRSAARRRRRRAAPPHQRPGVRAVGTGGSATPVQGLHLTFGADPARQMVASWITDGSVSRPRVVYGTLEGGFGVRRAGARPGPTSTARPAGPCGSTTPSWTDLRPNTDYIYAVQHDGATPDAGTFRTAPSGRAPFTFTSFGDQSAPQVTWAADGTVGLDANSTPATKDIVTGIETVAPLFHLLNGDLCYANLDVDRVRTWNNFFTNNTRSARFRPWMPAAGNHEIEKQNGPIGLDAFQAYFKVPSTETDAGAGRPVVLVHGRFGARDRAAERRQLPAGRRRRLHQRLLRRPAAGVAGERPGRGAPLARRRLDRRRHAPGDGQHLRRQRRRPWPARRSTARCSTSTASTWCCAGTSTTTSVRWRCAAWCPAARR